MDKTSFEEKELEILRTSIDNASALSGRKIAQSDDIRKLISILEHFLRTHKAFCYGGTAINNILPEQFRFYNRDIEVPDYDFYSPYAIEFVKKLADIYYNAGYKEVEAKTGVHKGTYKVFVNFIPIADITYMEKSLFNNIYKECIKVNGISYAPPNLLRMGAYQELSRPMGDVSRWEKVLKRLILLNKNYPLKGTMCSKQDFQRFYEGPLDERNKIYDITRDSFINQGLIFFGGYASSLYGRYMPKKEKRLIDSIPDFDVLSEEPLESATILKEQFDYEGFKDVKINKKGAIGGYVDEHYEIVVNKDTIALIYKANSCHSYNNIYINNQKIKVATIDTILSFYLVFIYAGRPHFDVNRLLCMSEYLFRVQLKNRLQQKGLLRRFTISCYGKQETLEDIRANKAKKYKELFDRGVKKGSIEYQENFLRYIPADIEKYKEKANENKNKEEVKDKEKSLQTTNKKIITKKVKHKINKPNKKPNKSSQKKPNNKFQKLLAKLRKNKNRL